MSQKGAKNSDGGFRLELRSCDRCLQTMVFLMLQGCKNVCPLPPCLTTPCGPVVECLPCVQEVFRSIPGRVITKTLKMVLDSSLFSTGI